MSMSQNNYCQISAAKRGFTLIEVMLVTAIISTVTLGLYQALSNGIRVWQHSQALSVEQDIMIGFDKLSMDLRNAFDFSLFEFEGRSGRIAFSTIVKVPMGSRNAKSASIYADQIGRVEYGFDVRKKMFYRRDANYGQALDGDFGEKRLLSSPVKGVLFRYFDRIDGKLALRKVASDQLPAAVEAAVKYEDSKGETRVLMRFINMPIRF